MSVLRSKLPERVADLFFPKTCIGCARGGGYLCSACAAALPRLLPPLCPRCGLPLGVEVCPACQGQRLEIDGVYAPFRFEGLARQAVHLLKYRNLKALAPVLSGLMAAHFRLHPLLAQAIVPVPLHRTRLRQRGYNQAELLTRGLGQELGLPVTPGWLERPQAGQPQARTPSREQRWHNTAGAFRTAGEARIPGDTGVLLVDDVCTTGATLNACAGALKAAGAVRVWGLTLAREI
ncbi:MAG: ComF family protein [Dehalococcoidia bacterium]